MLTYALRRIMWSIPVLIAVSLITFLLMHAVPGGPWDTSYGDRPISKATRQALAEQYGLEQPLYIQYLSYMAAQCAAISAFPTTTRAV